MSTSLLLVAAGGAIGSVIRYILSYMIAFPFGTLAVNVTGSFAIGFAFVVLAGRSPWQLLVITGFLGGFTTFSAFSLDTLRLFQEGRIDLACLYVVFSTLLSLLACLAGLGLARGAL